MKAKMPPGEKIPEAAEYLCKKCETRFYFSELNDELVCPSCGTADQTELVPVYMENDPQEEEMYSEDDWGQGD